ncbi:MAG: hypothetical protein SXA11_10260 [Cyanobacteriota bacterium]|nr:hypothetical protein [Cyanobacteriota bacterium]
MNKISKLFWLFALAFCQTIFPVRQPVALALTPFSVCPTASPEELPDPPLSQTQPTIPSLWLAEEIFGGNVLNKWFVEPSETWVILMVNHLIWKEMDYFDRYQFVHKFGRVSRQYGYNTLVCNFIQEEGQAAYFCDFDADKLVCNLELD